MGATATFAAPFSWRLLSDMPMFIGLSDIGVAAALLWILWRLSVAEET
jgi:hypothetical protein